MSPHATTLHYTPLHSRKLHYTPGHSTKLQDTPLHVITHYYTPLHSRILHYTSPHTTTLHSTPVNSTTRHHTLLHFTTLHYMLLHSTALHCTPLHSTRPSLQVSSNRFWRTASTLQWQTDDTVLSQLIWQLIWWMIWSLLPYARLLSIHNGVSAADLLSANSAEAFEKPELNLEVMEHRFVNKHAIHSAITAWCVHRPVHVHECARTYQSVCMSVCLSV